VKFNYNIIFYEKTGCSGNKKQKELLKSNGIFFHIKSILDTHWTKDTLEPFFEGLNKSEIINQFAPQIKNNEIKINEYSKEELIELVCQNPILIKRPLIQIGSNYICGFDIIKINNILGTNICVDNNISICNRKFNENSTL